MLFVDFLDFWNPFLKFFGSLILCKKIPRIFLNTKFEGRINKGRFVELTGTEYIISESDSFMQVVLDM